MMVGPFSFHSKVDVRTNIQSRAERRSKVSDKCIVTCHDTHRKNDILILKYELKIISMVDSS